MEFVGTLLSFILIVFILSFIVSAFVGWIAFIKDIHRFKSECEFKGTRKQFLNYLFDKIIEDKPEEKKEGESSVTELPY